MFPIARATTDNLGFYQFNNIQSESNTLYGVGTLVNGRRLSSEMLKLEDKLIVELNIEIPTLLYNTSNLIINKNVVIYNRLNEGIRIIEFIGLHNPTSKVISTIKKPLIKYLPPETQNFVMYNPNKIDIKHRQENDRIEIIMEAPPGNSQFFFEYDLLLKNRKVEYIHRPVESTLSLELLLPSNADFELKTETVGSVEERSIGAHIYQARIIDLNNSTKTIFVAIESNLLEKRQLIWIIAILFTMMLVGIIIYTLKKTN